MEDGRAKNPELNSSHGPAEVTAMSEQLTLKMIWKLAEPIFPQFNVERRPHRKEKEAQRHSRQPNPWWDSMNWRDTTRMEKWADHIP